MNPKIDRLSAVREKTSAHTNSISAKMTDAPTKLRKFSTRA